jgi:hypothetical protein
VISLGGGFGTRLRSEQGKRGGRNVSQEPVDEDDPQQRPDKCRLDEERLERPPRDGGHHVGSEEVRDERRHEHQQRVQVQSRYRMSPPQLVQGSKGSAPRTVEAGKSQKKGREDTDPRPPDLVDRRSSSPRGDRDDRRCTQPVSMDAIHNPRSSSSGPARLQGRKSGSQRQEPGPSRRRSRPTSWRYGRIAKPRHDPRLPPCRLPGPRRLWRRSRTAGISKSS